MKIGSKLILSFRAGRGEKVAEELSVPFLGRIPIDSRISVQCDKGKPDVLTHPESMATQTFREIADKVEDFVLQPVA